MRTLPYIIAACIGLSIGSGAYWAMVNKGVQKERVRVEAQGKKIDAKAKKARAAAVSRPATSVLDGEWRD